MTNLIIPLKWKNVLDYLVQKELEWHAFAKIEKTKVNGNVSYIMSDIYFPKQVNSSTTTEDNGGTADMAYDLKKRGENLSDWKLHIHSHHTMNAFWSSTDREQHEDWKSGDYMLGLVLSSKGNWKAILNLFDPVRVDVDLDIVINDKVIDQEELDKYKADLEEKETFVRDTFDSNWKEKQKHLASFYDDDDNSNNNNIYNLSKKKLKKFNKLIKEGATNLEALIEVRGNKFQDNVALNNIALNSLTPEQLDIYNQYIEMGYVHDEAFRYATNN